MFVYIIALVIHHATHRHRITVICGLPHILPRYLINDAIFGKTLLNIKCVFWFALQRLSKTVFILRIPERCIIITVHRSYVKYPLFLSEESNLNFLDGFSKNTHTSNFITFRPVGVDLLHAGRRTNRQKRQTWQS